jgi:hypothetical protein
MDCEKFESAMMDELYGELDELTSAAAKRHIGGCARCAARIGGLRATRRVATLPLVEAPPGLEDRILSAARDAQRVLPLRRRLAQAVSLAGSWAMRPQTAMAAVFLVMIGTSVLLLRGKALAPASAPVTVTEQGSPTPPAASAPMSAIPAETSFAAAAPAAKQEAKTMGPPLASAIGAAELSADEPRAQAFKASRSPRDEEAPSPPPSKVAALPPAERAVAAGAVGGAPAANYVVPGGRGGLASGFDAAISQYRANQFEDATRGFDALAATDPTAELWAARSVREGKGCRAAVVRFDRVAQRASGTATGWDALLEGARCFRSMNLLAEARVRLTPLLKVDSHKDKAQAELDSLAQMQAAQGSAFGPAAKAAPRARPLAPAATTAPNQATGVAY